MQLGQRYVLAVFHESGGGVGMLAAMEEGVFRVNDNSELKPMRAADLSHDLQTRGLDSLDSLRGFLAKSAMEAATPKHLR